MKHNLRRQNESKIEFLMSEFSPSLSRSLTLISQFCLADCPTNEGTQLLAPLRRLQRCPLLRYNWPLKFTSSTCICSQQQSLEHALSCSRGGFPTLHHNEIQDITASYLSEIRSNVAVEPHLQPLTGESLRLSTSNQDDAARVDIDVDGFWIYYSRALFDVRVFNPHVQSNASLSPTADMSVKSPVLTSSVFVKLNMVHSPP